MEVDIIKKEEKQIDKMINEGLGGGKVNNPKERKKLCNPISKRDKKDQKSKK